MRKAGKIALGCLGAPVALVLFLVMLALGFKAAGVPDAKPVRTELEQPMPDTPRLAARPDPDRGSQGQTKGGSQESALDGEQTTMLESTPRSNAEEIEPRSLGKNDFVRVLLDMEEGEFEIESGPAEQGIVVHADYDEATYDLSQQYDVDKDGTPIYRLRFRSKINFLRRVMQNGHFDDEDIAENHIRVQLPRETPIDLEMNLAKSSSQIDLTGLALRQSVNRFDMGEYALEVNEPNPVPMSAFVVDAKMGETRLDGLSHLRAKRVVTQGMMGEMRVDLGSALRNDTQLNAHMRMGEMRLRLPENAKWEFQHGGLSAALGEISGRTEQPGTPDPEGPTLRVNGGVFMGQLDVSSFPASLPLDRAPSSGRR